MLARLDVPYIAGHPAELQTLEQWGASDRGLLPVESTIMVAIPELDGATGPIVFGGRSDHAGKACTGCQRGCTFSPGIADRDMHACVERAEMLAARVAKLVTLRRTERAERKVAVVLFNFPPNAGNTGTAAYLSVFASLHATLLGHEARRLLRRCPGDRRRAAQPPHRRQPRALRRPCQRPCPHPRRHPCPPRALAARDREAVGSGTRPPAERRLVDLRARR